MVSGEQRNTHQLGLLMKGCCKVLISAIVACLFGCSDDVEPDAVVGDKLSLEVNVVSSNADTVEFEIIIKNHSMDKVDISSDGEKFEKSLVSEVEIVGKPYVIKKFPSSFTIEPGKKESHRFSLSVVDLNKMIELKKIIFRLGVMRWKIGESSEWQENPEGFYIETK